ncbi:hypothetical protein [Chromobacterium sp. LK1]|uniref:hypothetical protein n=1 Tax=Chromobacterium sp. LK1 TaxID=1628193 RepID=UPI0012E1A9CA|nr:hypothetical protein [Chromobacterium sp. LK1]
MKDEPKMRPKEPLKFNLPYREYHRLEQGATILGCTTDDLIHWAAHGAITLYANLYGQITLLKKSRCFIDSENTPKSEDITPDGIYIVHSDDMRTFELEGHCEATEFYQVDKHGDYWYAETDIPIELHLRNLFLPEWEIENLQQDTPSKSIHHGLNTNPPKGPHPTAERFATYREQILRAAIYCLCNWPEKCKESNRDWAGFIDEKAPLFWPQTGRPPLTKDRIERLLGECQRLHIDVE